MTDTHHPKNIALTALFAALTCAATMAVRIPTPGTGGYIHPGDAIVILSGLFLSPGQAFLAAGIGSGMADFFGGYFLYLPVTFAVKGLAAFLTGKLCRFAASRTASPWFSVAGGGILDILLVGGGYLLFEIFVYGPAAALASLPANLIQGTGGLIIACCLYPLLAGPFRLLRSAGDLRR